MNVVCKKLFTLAPTRGKCFNVFKRSSADAAKASDRL